MAKKNYYALGLCGLLALALCQSPVDAKTGIRISSFDPTLDSCEISTGIVYFLPKSVGKATYTYNLYKVTKTTKEDDKEKKTYSYYAKIESTPTIEMVSLADPDLGFEINPSNLKGLTIATAIEGISINESGVLTGINSKFEGKMPQIVKGLTASAINIAKIAAMTAMAGNVQDPNAVKLEEEKIASVTLSNYFDLESGKYFPGGTRDDYGVQELFARKDLEEAYTEYKINSDLMNDTLRGYVKLKGGDPSLLPDSKIPDIAVRLKDKLKTKSSSAQILKAKKKERFDGIVVRTPANAKFETHILQKYGGKISEDILVDEEYLPVAQCGRFSELKMDSNPFYTKDYKISLSKTGAITKYGFEGGSLGESLANMLSDVTTAAASAPTGVLGAQVDLLKKEAEILEAKANLQKKQNELDELNKKKGQ